MISNVTFCTLDILLKRWFTSPSLPSNLKVFSRKMGKQLQKAPNSILYPCVPETKVDSPCGKLTQTPKGVVTQSRVYLQHMRGPLNHF